MRECNAQTNAAGNDEDTPSRKRQWVPTQNGLGSFSWVGNRCPQEKPITATTIRDVSFVMAGFESSMLAGVATSRSQRRGWPLLVVGAVRARTLLTSEIMVFHSPTPPTSTRKRGLRHSRTGRQKLQVFSYLPCPLLRPIARTRKVLRTQDQSNQGCWIQSGVWVICQSLNKTLGLDLHSVGQVQPSGAAHIVLRSDGEGHGEGPVRRGSCRSICCRRANIGA